MVAQTIDIAELDGVLGTIAGDDTVLLICRDPHGGERLARRCLELGEGTDNAPTPPTCPTPTKEIHP